MTLSRSPRVDKKYSSELRKLLDECTTKLRETQADKTRDDVSTPINRKRKRDLSTAKDSQNSAISTVSGSLPGAKRSRPRSRSRGTREKSDSGQHKKVLRERERQKCKARKYDQLQKIFKAAINLASMDDTQSQDLSQSLPLSTSMVSSSTSQVSPSAEE